MVFMLLMNTSAGADQPYGCQSLANTVWVGTTDSPPTHITVHFDTVVIRPITRTENSPKYSLTGTITQTGKETANPPILIGVCSETALSGTINVYDLILGMGVSGEPISATTLLPSYFSTNKFINGHAPIKMLDVSGSFNKILFANMTLTKQIHPTSPPSHSLK